MKDDFLKNLLHGIGIDLKSGKLNDAKKIEVLKLLIQSADRIDVSDISETQKALF